ncbi:MAG: aminoacyl-tRNA hydrolase [Victivallaceae bacterium]|nr:aminoacyl-tRNA hydrolase [Victivallaceae bacterium]
MSRASVSRIRLIVGLGNPGREYEGTRHNVGFAATEAFLAALPVSFKRQEQFGSVYWEGRFKGRGLLVQQPRTFMNLSGKAVAALAGARGIAPAEIVAVYDDLDLPLGKIRIRESGGSAGHRGVESLIEQLGTVEFPRLRIGIGRTEAEAVDYVLTKFGTDERQLLDAVLNTCTAALILSLTRGIEAAMNSFNSIRHGQDENNNPEEKPGHINLEVES